MPNLRNHTPSQGLIRTALQQAIMTAVQPSTASEVPMVRNLTREIPIAINNLPQPLPAGCTITAGGVFVHQTPQIRCTTFPAPHPTRVEIGDLLLLTTHVYRGVIKRRAMLLQAKKTTCNSTIPRGICPNQYHIYDNRPEFYYVHSGILSSASLPNPTIRRMYGPYITRALKYLFLNPVAVPAVAETARLAGRNSFSNHCSLDIDITNFIIGCSGKPYDPTSRLGNSATQSLPLTPQSLPPRIPPRGTWSDVIVDLISVTASLFMSASLGGPSRGQGLYCLTGNFSDPNFILHQLRLRCTQNIQEISTQEMEPDNQGISIIEFVVTQDN